jgi:predicted nucleic acid-binding protein
MGELRRSGKLSTSTLVVFEVLRGTRHLREERTGRDFFTLVTVRHVDIDSAQKAAHIARSNRGVMFGDRAALDALIAGTALANGLTLVTLNTRQFSRLNVPGLRLLLIDQQARDWVAQVV